MQLKGLKHIISLVLCLLVQLSFISGQDQCPEGYGFSFKNSCYKFVNEEDYKNTAAGKCALEEAHLVDIKSEEEQYFIASWLKNNTNKDVWIGLSKQETTNYVWTDGSPVEYDAWAPDEPKNDKNCVRLRNGFGYLWDDRQCNQNNCYICEIEALGCPPGWHFHNQVCYFVNGQQRNTYDQARNACTQENAKLSSIINQDEQYFHNRFATLYGNLWIGLNDKAVEGTWKWEDASPYQFTNWTPGQPDNFGGNEDCAHLWEGRSGRWNDERCDRKYGYICKMPSAIPEPTTAPTTAAMTSSSLTSPVNEPTPAATKTATPRSTRTIPANITDVKRTPKPQNGGLPAGAIAGAIVGSILLLVLILLILFLIARRPRHKTQTESGKSTTLAFDGPYDLTIEGKSNYKPQTTEQPIYTDADGDNKQEQPIYANPTSTKPATNVYQSIGESSTDDNTAPVYVDVVPNNDAPNSNNVSVTGDQGNGQETSLYYARSDSHQDTNAAPNTSEQESCQDVSLYYAKSDSHPATKGDIMQQSNASNTGTGWEDNAAYSSFENSELVHDQDNLDGQQEQEGWEDNSIYAGSDLE